MYYDTMFVIHLLLRVYRVLSMHGVVYCAVLDGKPAI